MKLDSTYTLLGGLVLLAAVATIAYYTGFHQGSRNAADANAGPHEVMPGAIRQQWATVATYGNWQMRCHAGAAASDKKSCVGLLEVIDTKKHQLILGWLMGLNGTGGITSTFQTPTGVLVARGVDLQLGNSAVRHLDYGACGASGCEASLPMDGRFIGDAEAADQAKITLYAANGKAVNLGIPIKGVDKVVETFK